MTDNWNPQQYEKFKDQRAKPFFDLLQLIKKEKFRSAIDLGCGTGELTQTLFQTLQPASMLAIDSSKEMLAKSDRFKLNGLTFRLEDIAAFAPESTFDLVFSNAALQWLANHEVLIPKILSWVSPQGQIAIQMPFNFDHPSHVVALQTARDLFPTVFRPEETVRATLSLERYAEIFFENGFFEQTCRIEIYGHAMKSSDDVIEWTKGTLLTQYEKRLLPIEFQLFLKEYRTRLIGTIGSGAYFYAFKRALLWGQKTKSETV